MSCTITILMTFTDINWSLKHVSVFELLNKFTDAFFGINVKSIREYNVSTVCALIKNKLFYSHKLE